MTDEMIICFILILHIISVLLVIILVIVVDCWKRTQEKIITEHEYYHYSAVGRSDGLLHPSLPYSNRSSLAYSWSLPATVHGPVEPPYLHGPVEPPYLHGPVEPPYLHGPVEPPYLHGPVEPPYLACSDHNSQLWTPTTQKQNIFSHLHRIQTLTFQ